MGVLSSINSGTKCDLIINKLPILNTQNGKHFSVQWNNRIDWVILYTSLGMLYIPLCKFNPNPQSRSILLFLKYGRFVRPVMTHTYDSRNILIYTVNIITTVDRTTIKTHMFIISSPFLIGVCGQKSRLWVWQCVTYFSSSGVTKCY
jgi:hypothetical protein